MEPRRWHLGVISTDVTPPEVRELLRRECSLSSVEQNSSISSMDGRCYFRLRMA